MVANPKGGDMTGNLANDLGKEIEHEYEEYRKGGCGLGWRLLASPVHVLEGADIAFIGLNPGGRVDPPDHPRFAPKKGSAYVTERWAGAPPGQSPLQVQVRALFDRLDVKPENVLAGHLVPFRSPSWEDLRNRDASLCFGERLWKRILDRARPELVIAMGKPVFEVLSKSLGVIDVRECPLAWGEIKGRVGHGSGKTLVGLPHLSRFGVATREKSQPGLRSLFAGHWKK